jgi:hypothetical protein
MKNPLLELLNSDGKSMVFSVQDFDNAVNFEKINRYNFFAILLVLEGNGTLTITLFKHIL